MPLPKPKGKGNKSIGWNWMFLKWFSIIAITVLVVANFASTNLSLSVPLSNILSESVPPLLHRTNTENDQEISLTDHPMDGENDNIREADLFEAACLSHAGNKIRITYRDLFGSWDHKTSNRSDPDSINIATSTWVSFSHTDDEINETITNTYGLKKLPPIVYIQPMPNPCHCVQDMLFTLLPLVYRGDLKGARTVSLSLPDNDYCISTLTALGWFEQMHIVPDKTCFGKLWVPAFMHHRFPRGRSRGVQFNNGNGYLHPEDLPIEMIQFFQREMWQGILSKSKSEFDGGNNGPKTILFVSRRGLGRRMWENVNAIAEIVRQKLHSESVVHIIDDPEHSP